MDPARQTFDPAAALKLVGLTPASTFGALLLGYAFASIFYGITCCQTLNYYRSPRSKNDSRSVKFMVAAVWLLDTAHQAISTHIVYWYLIINYGQASSLFAITWSVPTEMVLNFIIGFIVQSFYVVRIWRITHNPWISGFCGFLGVATLGIGIVYPALLLHNPVTTYIELKYESLLTASLAVALVTDIILAIVLAVYLYTNRTGFRRTDTMLMRLIMLSIATGGLTACIWLANLIAFVAKPTALWDYLFNPTISKLYANSLLTMLNYRDFVAETKSTGDIDLQSFHVATGQSANTSSDGILRMAVPENMDVFMTKAAETDDSAKRPAFV